MKIQNTRVVSVLVTASIFACASLAVEAKGDSQAASSNTESTESKHGQRGSCHEVIVNAKPEAVFNAILKLRDDSDDTVKELSREGNHCILEEKFPGLPIVGDAKCVYKETYTPFTRIEYAMVRSEKFKAFEGRWLLTPTEDGTGTRLSLSSYIDAGIPVPFAKQITKMQTSQGVKDRLKEVKTACEKAQVARAASKSVTQ